MMVLLLREALDEDVCVMALLLRALDEDVCVMALLFRAALDEDVL